MVLRADQKARNVLVSSDFRCKVSDFGHARQLAVDSEVRHLFSIMAITSSSDAI